jgi:hypothetical protein
MTSWSPTASTSKNKTKNEKIVGKLISLNILIQLTTMK